LSRRPTKSVSLPMLIKPTKARGASASFVLATLVSCSLVGALIRVLPCPALAASCADRAGSCLPLLLVRSRPAPAAMSTGTPRRALHERWRLRRQRQQRSCSACAARDGLLQACHRHCPVALQCRGVVEALMSHSPSAPCGCCGCECRRVRRGSPGAAGRRRPWVKVRLEHDGVTTGTPSSPSSRAPCGSRTLEPDQRCGSCGGSRTGPQAAHHSSSSSGTSSSGTSSSGRGCGRLESCISTRIRVIKPPATAACGGGSGGSAKGLVRRARQH
jgi:hypothetical protein